VSAAALQQPSVVLRRATAADVPFILNSWLRSHWDAWGEPHGIPKGHYFAEAHRKACLTLSRAECLLAINPEDESHLLGYVVWEPGTLHYVYVKHPYRKEGLASRLVAATGLRAGFHYTHHTEAGRTLALRMGAHFNPGGLK
jgi:hypothetical protein